MMTDRKLNTREEADARYKWAIEDLYKDDEDWKRDYELLKSRIPELTKFRGRLGESAEVLLSMQKLSDELNQLLEKIYVMQISVFMKIQITARTRIWQVRPRDC